ncbi:Hypothetical protein D9617_108g071710 [Elsinoe fawcettii]|nr:Hypothetical protein D9617_108g071710 [Elsinoe fawcettii]
MAFPTYLQVADTLGSAAGVEDQKYGRTQRGFSQAIDSIGVREDYAGWQILLLTCHIAIWSDIR